MPFVLRVVEPVYLSRRSLTGADGVPLVRDGELDAVTNNTLSGALRQLSSLVSIANDIFEELNKQLADVSKRSQSLRQRIARVEERVLEYDPKRVTVPEGDLSAFSSLREHFRSRPPCQDGGLFTPASRPCALQRLYGLAARATLDQEALEQLDRLRRDGARSSTLFLCTPILARTRSRRQQQHQRLIDIETRLPASHVELRRWTSTEALGDVTVHPDCTARIPGGTGSEQVDGEPSTASTALLDQTDHRLPTIEEQVKAIADRFPPETVRMDVSGRSFRRMSQCRRSLLHPAGAAGALGAAEGRRRGRPRRHRSHRRNTIAGTDHRELEEALQGERSGLPDVLTTVDDIVLSSSNAMLHSSGSKGGKDSSASAADIKKWAFNSLRRWSKLRLRGLGSGGSSSTAAQTQPSTVSGELHTADPVDDINVYETVAGKRRGPSGAGTIPISVAGLSGPMSLAVKLREGGLGHRRLKICDEPPHSSSGNWSASSESGRASVNSDSSHQPKSSTCSSGLPHRRRFINTSTSSSVTSEGTLTPEDLAGLPFVDDGETSSVYSCDTEGYYTSFHMDSGLKTLKEEEGAGGCFSLPETPMHSTTALSNCSSGRGSASLAQLTAESEYELFGKGSTSTTASSAGTVCTTLLVDNSKGGNTSNGSNRSLSLAPAVPERKSSLSVPCLAQECPPCSTVVALIHNRSSRSEPADSPDSGHNTSSSPIDSASSPQDTETDALISPIPSTSSEMEFSECSDFEGIDRIERIRVKTTINSSRIPSMCVITPPQSDDETSLQQYFVATGNGVQNASGRIPIPHSVSDSTVMDNETDVNKNVDAAFKRHEHEANSIIDNNANKSSNNANFNTRTVTHSISGSTKTNVIEVDNRSGYATVHTVDNALKENNNNQKIRPPSPSGGTLFINTKAGEEPLQSHNQPIFKNTLLPFANVIDKFRGVLASKRSTQQCQMDESSTKRNSTDSGVSMVKSLDDCGDYVTITDVRNNNKPTNPQCAPQCSEASESEWKDTTEAMEYVSLNELPVSDSSTSTPSNILSGSSSESSLERKRRQGARVTLDSEGKVVYSSDSLRRRKGAHTTFEPGSFVKDPNISPTPSPVAAHRVPKAIIRPVNSQSERDSSVSQMKSGDSLHQRQKSPARSTVTTTTRSLDRRTTNRTQNADTGSRTLSPLTIITSRRSASPHGNGNRRSISPHSTNKPFSPDQNTQRSKHVIRAGVISPSKDLARHATSSNTLVSRSMSPHQAASSRGAYVHIQSDPPSRIGLPYLQTDFDGPHNTQQQATQTQPESEDQGGGDVDLGVADLGEPVPKPCLNPDAVDRSNGKVVHVVHNPHIHGRRFYGAQVMVNPSILLSLTSNRVTKPADTQRARVLSMTGYISSQQKQPPRYISPPKVCPQPRYPPGSNQACMPINRENAQPVYQNCLMVATSLSSPQPQLLHFEAQVPSHVPKPATVSSVPVSVSLGSDRRSDNHFHSTPIKSDPNISIPSLHISSTFSPIEPGSQSVRSNPPELHSPLSRHVHSRSDTKGFEEAGEIKSNLIAPPKTTMTSEELYAAIHKSKKKMNIKYEPEIAVSPSPSVCGSQSPVGSERSLSPGSHPEAFEARTRHSWSPNSSKYFDFYNHFEHRSSSPSPSKLCEPGLTQVTSRYDFKRLLLQHGSGNSSKSKLSAVERLKLAKQAAANALANNASKLKLGLGGSSGASSEKGGLVAQTKNPSIVSSSSRIAPNKPGPRSIASWRFTSPRSDVLSTPILEDHIAEEQAQEPIQIQKLSASPMPARNTQSVTRRALELPVRSRLLELKDTTIGMTTAEGNQPLSPQPKEGIVSHESNLVMPQQLLQSPSQRMKVLLAKQRSHYSQTTMQSMLEPAATKTRGDSPPALETAL